MFALPEQPHVQLWSANSTCTGCPGVAEVELVDVSRFRCIYRWFDVFAVLFYTHENMCTEKKKTDVLVVGL